MSPPKKHRSPGTKAGKRSASGTTAKRRTKKEDNIMSDIPTDNREERGAMAADRASAGTDRAARSAGSRKGLGTWVDRLGASPWGKRAGDQFRGFGSRLLDGAEAGLRRLRERFGKDTKSTDRTDETEASSRAA